MFPHIYPLLRKFNPQLSETQWLVLFEYAWSASEPFCGYGLYDGTKAVGYMGLLFSQRMIDNKLEHFCNITSWVVEEPYRGHSISMILALRNLKDYTFTDLSPTPAVVEISKRLGFLDLDPRLKLLPWFFGRHDAQVTIFHDPIMIDTRLNPAHQPLLRDHLPYTRCCHLLIEAHGDYCYLIYTLVKNYRFPYIYIHYVSNLDIFARYSGIIRRELISAQRMPWVVIDSRLVRGIDLPLCFELPFAMSRLYKSPRLKPEQIDNLYSELILLDFNTIPGLGFREFKERVLGKVQRLTRYVRHCF